MSSFMGLVVFGCSPSGQIRPWKVKHHWPGHKVSSRWQRDAAMVGRCRRAGGKPFTGMGKAQGCSAPWGGKAQMSSLCPSPQRPGFRRAFNTTSVVEPASLNTSSPGEELLKSSLTQPRMGNAGSGDSLDTKPYTEEAALPHQPWPCVGQVLLQAEDGISMRASRGFSFLWICPPTFSNHDEEIMKP